MRRLYEVFVPLGLVLAAIAAMPLMAGKDPQAPSQAIHIREVAPFEAKAGDIAVASGDNLSAARVLALYLTDGKTDMKVEILEQTDTMIRFRIPAKVAPGKLRLAIQNEAQVMLDQPAFIKILVSPGPPTGA